MVSTNPLISKSSSPFINPSVTVPRAPITIGINVTFMSRNFFQLTSNVEVLSLSFNFTLWSAGAAKSTILQVLFFIVYYKVWPRLGDPFVCQNPIGVCVSHSPGQILGCAYSISSYNQISISCTIPSESPCAPCRVLSYTLTVLICCIRLLCD